MTIMTGFMTLMPYEVMVEITKAHFAAIVGLPIAAIFAAFIVVALLQASGPVKFEGLGFKFEGAFGKVVLWVVCFLSITGAIRMLCSA